MVIVLLAAAAFLARSAAPRAAVPCKAGLTKINGQPARVFCGPARAVVHVGGQTLRFKQGSCSSKGGIFSVNIGQSLLPPGGPYPYFGVVKRGADAAVSYRFGLVHDSILNAKLVRHGDGWTFSGISLLARKTASGSFSCT